MNENLAALFAGVGGLIYLALIVFMIACQWKIFTKAGRQGKVGNV